MSELSLLELEHETVELLPRREALGRKRRWHSTSTTVAIATNVSVVEQQATSVAINFGSGDAVSSAANYALVLQEATAVAIND